MTVGLKAAGPATDGSKPYVLAVVPRFTAPDTHRLWSPFVERLSKETGVRFELRVYRNRDDFENELALGTPDFAYMDPYLHVKAHRRQGYIPLVRDSRPLEGFLLVRADGPIRTLKDLNGKVIVFPHPNAFASSLYMRALLGEQAGIRFTARYLNNHSNVYRHVVQGRAAAGGGVNHSLILEPESLQAKLRVLYTTPETPSHPLSAHPRVPVHVRQAVIRAVLRMDNDGAGRRLLKDVVLGNPVKADYRNDYGPIERLRIEKYYVPVRQARP